MATKRIKFIKPWNMTAAGAEMELDTPIADLLISRGRAEEIKEAQALAPVKNAKRLKRSHRNKGK